ncbi:MAG: hypothetical protein Q7J27_10870 [Syntrophales bacterium]|nr:hypothetical protein [Syntrophales bacterium]
MNKIGKILLILACSGFLYSQLFPQDGTLYAGTDDNPFKEKLYPQGKKFPFGIWTIHTLHAMKQVKKDGFNFIQCYSPGEGTEEEIKQWLEWAKDTELFVMFNMGGFRKQAVFNEDGRHMKSFARRLETYKNYEHIAWWNLPEEKKINDGYEGPMIKAYCKYLHENDPLKRPVYMYPAAGHVAESIVPYVTYLDIIGGGIYTSLYKKARPWVLWVIQQEVKAIKESGVSNRMKVPIAFLQLSPGDGIPPTFTEIYYDIYASIIAGAKGVVAYYLHHSREVLGAYDAYAKAAKELAGEAPLGSAVLFGKNYPGISIKILSGPEIVTFLVNRNREEFQCPSINFSAKEHDGRFWLIAVNSSNEKVAAEFRGFPGRSETLKVSFEKREITLKNGSFREDFEPLAVHIYYKEGLK